jgi:hypothetical protein
VGAGVDMAKPIRIYKQRPVTLQGSELSPGAMEQRNYLRSRTQRFSDSQAGNNPIFPHQRPQTAADVRPGQRIVSPSVLHAWFPAHETYVSESGGLPPPPSRVGRVLPGDSQSPQSARGREG